MDLPHRKLISDSFILSDTCSSECDPSDGYCISYCIKFCIINCPNRLPPLTTSISRHTVFPKKFLVAAFVLGITVISLICLTVYYKFYSGQCIRRRRGGGFGGEEHRNQIDEEFIDEDHGPVLDHPIWYINTIGLQQSVINSITVCKYKKGDGLVEGTDCSVCLSEFEEDETLRLLPKCSHAFHIPCIDTWLRSHTNCPLCRAPIVVSNPSEPQIGVAENREENSEIRDGEMRIETQEGDDLGLENEDRRKRVEFEEEEGIRALRRSISVDNLSNFSNSQALAGVHRDDSVKENESRGEIVQKRVGSNQGLIRFMASSSLQIGPSSLKRSISCGGKLFLQRYSRNSSSRRSVLPL